MSETREHSKVEHTALPWEHHNRVVGSKWGNTIVVCEWSKAIGVNGEHEVGTAEQRANAAYIVQACNAYPELVSVITSLCDELESYCEGCETVNFAREALSIAQGETQ